MEQTMNNRGLDGMSAAALGAMAMLGRLCPADRDAVLGVHRIALGPRLWSASDPDGPPRLTRLVPERDRERVYASPSWASSYAPTRWQVAYAAQSPGLATLSACLGGVGLAKVGTARLDAVERRLADLGSEQCGAWHRGGSGYEREPGFSRFYSAPRLQLAPQHPLSPVKLGAFGVEVGLPVDLSADVFEAEFNARLRPLRLHVVGGTAAGRALCARAGADPALLTRFHRRGTGFVASTELTLLRPQADCAALARLCADIVIDHVLGILPRRSGR